jgi:hypothetical protein
MKKLLFTHFFMIFFFLSYSQDRDVNNFLSDSIRKNFDYERLSKISCTQVPTGIYALSFKIDKQKKLYDFTFSHDSLYNGSHFQGCAAQYFKSL